MSRTGCSARQVGGAIEAALVDRDDVEVVPGQSDRVLEVGAQDRLVGEPVDRGQRLGERQRRGAPHRIGVERVEHDPPVARPSTASASSALVSSASVIRGAPCRARSMRTPDHTATGAGGRHGPVRRGGTSAPDEISRSMSGAASSSGASWATGRPWAVMIVRSPAVGAPNGAGEIRAKFTDARLCAHAYTSRFGAPSATAATIRAHELRLHRGTGRAALHDPRLSRGQEPRERRARADGDRGRLRPGGVEPDGGADGSAGPAHPRGVRRLGVQLRRARDRARGDGAAAAVRAVLLHRRAGRQRAAPVRRRQRQEGAPARHRQRRDDRRAGLHRALGQVGRVGHHDGGHEVGRRLHAVGHEELRDRRPHRRPADRRRPHRQRRQPVRRRRRRGRHHQDAAVDDGPDAQAGQARLRRARRRR